jgi:signal transduction histidine kinase
MRVGQADGQIAVRRPLAELLIEPLVALGSVDRYKARLLASLLLCLLTLGLTSAVVQAFTVPNFEPTLWAISGGLTAIFLAYVGSRTRHYRLSAGVAALALVCACVTTGVRSPDDRVWYGFLLIAVVFAALFFSLKTAMLVAIVVFAVLCVSPVWIVHLREPERIVPLLALHGVLSPLFLVAAHHQALIEREAQAELRRMNARLAEAEQLEVIARAAGSTIHDINNLITIIDANASFLEQRTSRPSEELVEIRAALDRAAALSRTLLNSSRRAATSTATFDVPKVVRDFLPFLARLAGPSVHVSVRASRFGGAVSMSPLRLEQMLMNLVTNARDAMPSGGKIVIECREITLGRDELAGRDARPGPHAMIAVSDTGTGMDAATLERVFEPFYTTKPGGRGTGLGLAIVRDIVEQSGGHVVSTSVVGQGTTFRAYLPIQPERPLAEFSRMSQPG